MEKEKELESANVTERQKVIENYVSSLNHDLRNPIAVMMGCAEAVLNEKLSREEIKYFLQAIMDTGEQTLKMIDNYLLLHKVESGKKIVRDERAVVSLADEIKKIFFGIKSNKKLLVSVKNPENNSLDPAWLKKFVLINKSLFLSLVTNLLRNAIEATTEEGGEIKVAIYKEKDNLCISFSNFGTISPEVQEKLFQKFSTSKKHGNGLGLYSARLIAKAHDGDLVYQSIPDGTRFIVKIPLV
ncbi:MAG: HAMP domain-containing sensor histidine kinase [Candidatus Falkowbacteria bacterium]